MNAEAYLRKQGWQGSGHSLDSTGRGIKKPLLISHKQDQLGLGKKKAAHTTDDQWWMRAFDQSLQNIGTGKESTLSQIRTKGINRGGLYGFFVKGEQIVGTIQDASAATTDASAPSSGASTPPTSASDIEAPAPAKNMSDKENKQNKRKRGNDVDSAKKENKKAKREEDTEQAAVAAKLARLKLKPSEKADYETRAAAKNQTLEQYILRRIQKKAGKPATEHIDPAPAPPLFFTDLEGDANLVKAAKAEKAARPLKYTPLPNGTCPLDPSIWEGRHFGSLPKKVQKAKLEYEESQRVAAEEDQESGDQESDDEESDDEDIDDEDQEPSVQLALVKIQAALEELTPLQREQAMSIAEKTMLAAPRFDYTPLPDGSCPPDPTIWAGHRIKRLPKPVCEARRKYMIEKRLSRKTKNQTENQKKLGGLTEGEEQLIRQRILGERGLDPKTATAMDIAFANEETNKRVQKKKGFEQKESRKHKDEKETKKAKKAAEKAARMGEAPK
ncbi:hypothetical protein EJ02DRAFT_421182 [Clathrospora elynae]|uniref:G-patch domain-containing protein n=1 Tax=Clathrospora elynae TaxID=706981 RepID=A0A6A5SV09_9PLEO|nr:hypothetical protein EJ02DRAFT_421182 [Clathrospora elynae]